MSFFKSVKKAARSVYNQTSKSSSKLGKVLRHIPGTAEIYATRDAWRKYGKKYFTANSAGSLSSFYGGDVYGPTGSIVGRT